MKKKSQTVITARIRRNDLCFTKNQRCQRCKPRRAALTIYDRCDPFLHWHNLQVGGPGHCSKRSAQPFPLIHLPEQAQSGISTMHAVKTTVQF